jgi:SAM-dependent methyltransferase
MMRAVARALVYRVPREAEACPACGSARLFDLDLMPLKRGTDGPETGFVSGCNACGLVFVNPLPSESDQAAFYSPDGAWHGDRSDDVDAGACPERATRVEGKPHGTSWSRMFEPMQHQLSVLAPPRGAAALDFGCGNGKLLDDLKRAGWDTWGVEPATDLAFDRHHRLDVVPDRPMFDLIVCHHVLEHVTNPLALLRRFAAAARPGGHLLVSVPRLDTLPIHRDYHYVINGRAHITAYTWPCLQGLLARAGWAPVAPPPDRVSKGRGKQTASRLRVIARRADREVAPAFASPADEARLAVRRYYAQDDGRTMLERMGWYRTAARQIEARRRGAIKARRARRRMVV